MVNAYHPKPSSPEVFNPHVQRPDTAEAEVWGLEGLGFRVEGLGS